MSGGLVVRATTADDHPAVLDLLAASLGWSEGEGLAEYFAWKHRANPLGPSPEWVAEVDGRIAGYRTFLRWEFEDGAGRTLRAVRAVDTATHPDFRGRGVFRELTLAAVDAMTAEGVDFVFNTPNDQSRPGYLKMGWHTIGRLPAAVRVRGPRGAFRLLGARVAAERRPLPGGGGVAAPDLLADPRLDALLARLGPATGLRTRRTAAHLRWRYGHPPLGYRAIALADDPTDGLVVYRVRRRGTAREAAVCEVLVPDSDPRAIAGLLRAVRRATGADHLIRLTAPGPRAGFVPVPRLGPVLTWRALAAPDRPPARAEWNLALGDVELL